MRTFVAAITTLVALGVFTVVFVIVKMYTSNASAITMRAVPTFVMSSPLYWILIIALLGALIFLFRGWVLRPNS